MKNLSNILLTFAHTAQNMVTNHISAVIKQAITTFSSAKEVFHKNLEILTSLLDRTIATDVDLHPQFMSEQLWKRKNKAPVTYVDIYEDPNLSVGIFILKPGMKLPLHDHPHMYGLIKVIAGVIKITSFSVNTEATRMVAGNQIEFKTTGNFITDVFLDENKYYRNQLLAELNCDMLASADTGSCILEPEKGNLHEIESVGGPAAFIDILSPPYETYIPNVGPRKCSYYVIVKELTGNVFKLEETASPSWYWNDTFRYTGPQLVLNQQQS